jgi:uncharacterized membrane protein YkvA (DUF1232 family)
MEAVTVLYLAAALLLFFLLYIYFSHVPPTQLRNRVESDTCAICLEKLNYEAQAACGHIFCCNSYSAECILTVWERRYRPALVPCPICRQPITLMVANFHPANDESRKLQRNLDDYNVRYSEVVRGFWTTVTDIPFVLRRLVRDLADPETLCRALFYVGILAAGVLYFLLPDDLLPEAELGAIGYSDDLLELTVSLIWVTLRYYAQLRQNSADRLDST